MSMKGSHPRAFIFDEVAGAFGVYEFSDKTWAESGGRVNEVEQQQAAIKAERVAIEIEMSQGQAMIDRALADMRSLQSRCQHPNEVRTSHMGETCLHCYDCGHCP